MRLSVDLMNSMTLMNTKHSNNLFTPTGFACRVLLVLCVLMLSVGSAWGEETDLNYDDYYGWKKAGKSNFTNAVEGSILRFYTPSETQLYIAQDSQGSWQKLFDAGDGLNASDYYNFTKGCAEFTINSSEANILKGYGLIFGGKNGASVTKVTLENPVDNFPGEAKSTCDATGVDITKYLTTETQLTLDVTKATAKLPSETKAKYARFYVLHNGVAENLKTNTTLLEVSGITPAAQLPQKGTHGYYLYNSDNDLDLSSISVKLNATAGEFPDYQVICLLSTSVAEAATGNVVTEEPDWDVQFTYSFRNQVTTKNQGGTVAWDAVSMTTTIPTTDIATNWGTSWANLAQEQKIQWYVTNGSDVVQPLTTGTARQDDTWTINLSSPFSVTENVAVMTGQTAYNATSFEENWATWGAPVIYAPANMSFADVQDYKIICKIADDANAVALPNVVYTLTLTNDFAGQNKSSITTSTMQVKLSATTDTSKDIDITLPTGTKYARFYVLDGNGDAVDPTDATHQLTITGGKTYTDKTLGYYLYDAGGVSLTSITFSGSSANLDEYQVVVVTSAETAVLSGSDVQYEPDFESQTTYWFNYPATPWNTEVNVEWSAQSMTVTAPDIEGNKGSGYLANQASHYTMQWYVVDDDGIKNLVAGNSRVDDYWSINVSNNPFTINDNKATVTNNSNLSVTAWNKWAAPQFYAPKNATMAQLAAKNTRFVCVFYEDDDASDANMQAMTYTVSINKTKEMGELKEGGTRGSATLTPSGGNMVLDLTAATTAFGETPKYIRVYVEKTDGTLVDPSVLTGLDGYQNFNTATKGYYKYSEGGVALPSNATLTLPEGQFDVYHVVVCLSKDTGESSHIGTGQLASHRAPTVMTYYEPDYDYIYTIKFKETSVFPGNLDNLVKSHSRELLVQSTDDEALIPLNETSTVSKFMSEMGASGSFNDMTKNYYHVRWFVAKKNGDGTYEKVNGSESMLEAVTSGKGHLTETNQGLYWNSAISGGSYVDDVMKVNFKKPTGEKWSDYKVFVWMTNDNTGAVVDGAKLSQEPDNIKVQYIYSFFEEDKLKFIHSKGASGRDYLTKSATDTGYRDTRIGTVGSPSTQYDWNNATSTGVATTDDIRQSVHTVEYTLYVDPTLVIGSDPAGEVKLLLPFQYYTSGGNNLEPSSYIRWYDYTTDLNSSLLKKKGTGLFNFEETLDNSSTRDRGLFFLDRAQTNGSKTTFDNLGVNFMGNQLAENQTAVIACDVSKYYDGIYQGSTKLLPIHEPTLSVRYIFTIRHAKVCAEGVKTKADTFENAKNAIQSGTSYSSLKNTMFDLFENNGRTVVSLNGTSGEFSLRAALADLSHYHIYTAGSTTGVCDNIDWYAYYEDEEGLWYKSDDNNTSEYYVTQNQPRIYNAAFSNLSGTYRLLSDNTKKKSISTAQGTKIHLVGYLKSGSAKAAALHYELCFIDAPAVPLLSLRETEDEDLIKRTDDYLETNLTPAGKVTFDDKFLLTDGVTIDYSKPTSWEENILDKPLKWGEAQYSFCYPDIDEYRQDNGYTGFNPQHGDYLLLKSMNLSGVSESSNNVHLWYFGGSPTLRDYTYTYKYGDGDTGTDYGGFFYVDASDEARTMANLKFSAALCRGSEIHFTMALADVTSSGTAPQVVAHVYTTKDGKKDKLVMSFLACTLEGAIIKGGTKDMAKWYQYYGYGAIPTSINLTGSMQDFIVEIDNNSKNTLGADFCVDQIAFYTSTTKLKVKQSISNCGDTGTPMNLYVNATDITSYTGQKIYWRFVNEDGTPVAENASNTLYANGGKNYGESTVPSTIPATIPTESGSFASGYFTGNDGVLYFSLANRFFDIEEGKQYFVSVYNLTAGEPSDESLWGSNTNVCDVYSNVFRPKRMYLSVDDGSGNDKSTVTISCGATTATVDVHVTLNLPDDTQVSGFKSYNSVRYDYFVGSIDDFNSYKITVGSTDYYLADALKNYRGKQDAGLTTPISDVLGTGTTYSNPPGTTYQGETSLNTGYQTNYHNFYAVIKQAVDANLLYLSCSNQMTGISVSETSKTISALPVDDRVTVTDNDGNPRKDNLNNDITAMVCSPLEITFKVVAGAGGPTIVLGFEDVTTYPTSAVRVIRVGKEQLDNMQKTDGYLLHIPVNTFTKEEGAIAKDGTLQLLGDVDLLAYKSGTDQTTDANISANVSKVATFEGTDITSGQMYISVNFHGYGVTKPTFYEGFAYRMFFQFKDKNGGAAACEGSAEFLIKVVPKYVTWKGISNEWNSDANWNRSEREELYKGIKDSETNTDDYEENGEGTLSTVSTTPDTYVPMKFTYVTLPTGLTAPNLVNLAYDAEGIYNNTGTGATTNIQYDLMVRYTETTCQGGTNHTVVSGDIYDCEKFYGNWAKELYLKPGAELLNQHYLTYEKVWVEKELTANTWTLMSTPLQNTYAGDMYVPYDANTEANNGRQITEAFQPITFSTTANTAGFLYSRAKYPIYQKGWTQADCKVYTKTNDVRATDYSANIPGSVNTVLNQWSHQYNDVTVPYSTWTAFAIRTHKKAQTANTLIRLPKADTSYDYYQWDNTSPDAGKLNQAVSKTTTGKLLTDGTANISGVTYGTVYGLIDRTAGDGSYNATIANIQSAYNYQLVGNPYLCSIDMAQFLTVNAANLETAGYWTYTNNSTGTALTTGTVGPMQSFFVKAKSGATAIIFTPGMMIDGAVSSPAPNRVQGIMLTAQNEQGQSEASITLGEGQNVETLFDSNLANVPMVYTVADGKAVSINRMEKLETVCFGVTCANDDAVDVTLQGLEHVEGELYMVDAVTGESTQVEEGSVFAVVPNEYGRYFLTRSGDTTGMKGQLADGIRVSVHGGVVSVKAAQELGTVRIVSVNGDTMYQEAGCGQTVEFQLQQGIYVVEVDGPSIKKATKIFVK